MRRLAFGSMVRGLRPPGGTQGLVPSLCDVCHAWGHARVCRDCLLRFAAPHARCAHCGIRTGTALARCGECLREPPPFRATFCAVDYGFPWQDLIAQFKFHRQVELATPLASLMLHSAPTPTSALLPVPLAPARLAQRGYNQAWELARRLGQARGIPARADVLLRPLDTTAQVELNRGERRRNLRAAFMVAPQHRAWLQGRSVALVDDVMTTGATAHEAASTLLRAGAAAVDLWVLARTPAPGMAGAEQVHG